jgi:hypothetical protein
MTSDSVEISRLGVRTFTVPSEYDVSAELVHRGECVEIPELSGSVRVEPLREHDGSLGVQVWVVEFEEFEYVAGVDGVADAAAVDAALLDTVRAWQVRERLRKERSAAASAALSAAVEDLEASTAARLGRPDPARYYAAKARRNEAVAAALSARVPVEWIAGVLDVDAERVCDVAGLPAVVETAPLLLGINDIAERTGRAPATIRQYRSTGSAGLPPADEVVSGTPLYRWGTVEWWHRHGRRGRGWAAGTTADEAGRRR